jgi:hypothetical protein
MVQTEARVMASSLVEYDTIDKYVDYDLYTQTVDPNRQNPWIYEGDYNHKHSVENGRKIREQQLNVLLPMLAVASETAPDPFVPSADEVETLPKFPSKVGIGNWGCDTWRGGLRDVRGVGVLPIVAQTVRDQTLIRRSRRRTRVRCSARCTCWRSARRACLTDQAPQTMANLANQSEH